MKKRVLLCTESSRFATGYGVYGRELLKRLNEKYDIAELACYVTQDDQKVKNTPWKVYANKPHENDPEFQNYLMSSSFEYGEFIFNNVLLDFRPHYVLDFRDPWAFEYQSRSPFRDYFNWIISPTIDARPQNAEWMELYGQADGVITYSDFGMQAILDQCPDIKTCGVASPAASDAFHPFDVEMKKSLRASNGIPEEVYILGTVMRNQPRKLFPELFKLFKRFLQTTGRQDVYLYCHTAFPDVGWNIPELLIDNDISSRVLFTYKCVKCNNVSVSHFSDTIKVCDKCGNYTKNIAGIGNSLTEDELNYVYNMFDVYIQYATNEGFGIPIVEASKAGIPVMNVNYSSMEDFPKKLGTFGIDVLTFTKESSTSRLLAIPNENSALDILGDLFSMEREKLNVMGQDFRNLNIKTYSWDKNADVWINAIESTPIKSKQWNTPPEIMQPHPFVDGFQTPEQQAEFLICGVLQKPEFMYKHTWRRLIKDLTYRTTANNAGGILYFNEEAYKDNIKNKPFSFNDAYQSMCQLREYYNKWEINRHESNVHR